jgi:arsenate reductase
MGHQVPIGTNSTGSAAAGIAAFFQGQPDRIDYHVLGLTRAQLDEIVRKTGLSPRQLLRTKEPEYKQLGLNSSTATDEEILQAMVTHPALLERPVVIKDDRAVLARPAEKVLELF